MMRLKQLLGIILLAIVTTTAAAGSTSQLAGIRVEHQDNASFVTISANGAFTHTEYRPTDSLMLVDLAGVSIAHPDAAVHSITSPGVQSYRIVGYHSANGMEVARIELNLARGATVKVNDVESGVELRISGGSAATVARPVAEKVAKAPTENVVPAVAPHESARMSHINNIAIARGKDGINIEVTGSEPMTARTMKLTGPDRVVLDIPNSVLEGRSREIPVNSSDVKDVRAARFQSAPPATRIVVDMSAMRDFEVVPSANKLVLKFKGSEPAHKSSPNLPLAEPVSPRPREASLQPSVAPSAAADKTAVATSGRSASVQPQAVQPQAQGKSLMNAQPPTQGPGAVQAQDKAQNVVIVNPVFSPKESASAETQSPSGETQSKADRAASRFANPGPAVVASNRPDVVPGNAAFAGQPAVVNAALQQQQQQPPAAAGPASQLSSGCTSGRYTGEPVSMDLKDVDLKDFFRFIKEISGLNVIVDPSVHGTVTIDISDIPWDQALALVLRNSSLECELQGNVLRIAALDTLRAESEARKAQQDAQALQVPMQNFTWYLSYAHAKDVVPVIKKFLSARGSVVPDERSNGLIIEDIPQSLPKVQSLLKELDRKTQEVEIEARVVAATRTFARDIGTQLGFGFGNGKTTAIGGATTAGTSPITVTPAPGAVPAFITAGTNSIPLFSNLGAIAPTSGLSFTNFTNNYRLDFVLTMAESRGLVKILSRPRVVTQNNLLALVKQGTRIPVVTQAQLGGPPTVQYIDAFLRLQVTPQITADNTIFLQVDVENTVPDFSRVTGTQLNPSLITQQATTNVLVTDGGTVVIGGVIQTQNSVAINQVPLLGNIPILGNLFKHQIVNTSTQELIFFISPKIVQS